MPASVGVCRTPVSRLFTSAGWPIAVRVLIADAVRDASGPVLVRARVTRLKVAAIETAARHRSHHADSRQEHPRSDFKLLACDREPVTVQVSGDVVVRGAGAARGGPSEHAAPPQPEIGRRRGPRRARLRAGAWFTRVDFGRCDPRNSEATAGASVRLMSVVLTSA
jgi:hypothetical protein